MTCTQWLSKILGYSAAAAQRDEPFCTLAEIESITTASFFDCVCDPASCKESMRGMPAWIMVDSCWNRLKMSSLLIGLWGLEETRACDRRNPRFCAMG